MEEGRQNHIPKPHNQNNRPSISPRVYHRRIRRNANPNLPEELIVEILKRLPVASILRFMCVCKSWYSLITNPSFISTHLSHQSNPTFKTSTKTIYSVPYRFYLHNIDDNLDDWVELDCPVGILNLIVGCCNGVICLFDYFSPGRRSLILWNPSIRKAFALPLPISIPDPAFMSHVLDGGFRYYNLPNFTLGFGFDPVSKDYKVVRVYWRWEKDRDVTFLHADVCSLSKNGWRTVKSSVEGGRFDIKHRGVYVSGVIHWMCKLKLANKVFLRTVLAFNLANEEFSQILLPNPLSCSVLLSVRVIEDEDKAKLAVSSTGDESNVWVMEEYGVENSWRKLLDCHIGDYVGSFLGAMVARDGKIVVTTSVGNRISWDPNNQHLENLALPVLDPDYVDTYAESLLLLNFENKALHCRKLPLEKKVRKRLSAQKYRSYVNMLSIIRSEYYRN